MARATLALAIGILVLAGGLEASGYDAARALGALFQGAFGSWEILASATLVRAIPLILVGLGLAFAFQAGSFNIGAEGQFYAGAIAATWVGVNAGGWPPAVGVALVLGGSAAAGMAWVGLPVYLKTRHGISEVITTLLLNFVADALVSFMVLGPLQEARGVYPQSDQVGEAVRIAHISGTRLPWTIGLAVGLALVLAFIRARTLFGFQLRVVGANPRAAWVSGRISVSRITGGALLFSGLLAGLAGGLEVAGVTFALFQNLSPGYGFTAIAVALLARLHPLGIIATGILFAALQTGAGAMQRDAGVPAAVVHVVEAVVILVILVGDSLARTPAQAPAREAR